MTTKDWQSEVEAAAEEAHGYYPGNTLMSHLERKAFLHGKSCAREKLEAYYSLPKVPQSEAVRQQNKRVIERERKLVEALEKIAMFDTDAPGLSNHMNDIARAALKAWRGEK